MMKGEPDFHTADAFLCAKPGCQQQHYVNNNTHAVLLLSEALNVLSELRYSLNAEDRRELRKVDAHLHNIRKYLEAPNGG